MHLQYLELVLIPGMPKPTHLHGGSTTLQLGMLCVSSTLVLLLVRMWQALTGLSSASASLLSLDTQALPNGLRNVCTRLLCYLHVVSGRLKLDLDGWEGLPESSILRSK